MRRAHCDGMGTRHNVTVLTYAEPAFSRRYAKLRNDLSLDISASVSSDSTALYKSCIIIIIIIIITSAPSLSAFTLHAASQDFSVPPVIMGLAHLTLYCRGPRNYAYYLGYAKVKPVYDDDDDDDDGNKIRRAISLVSHIHITHNAHD